MEITPYNKDAAIEYLKALAFIYFMKEAETLPSGVAGERLWDICAPMTKEHAEEAIRNFEDTQRGSS